MWMTLGLLLSCVPKGSYELVEVQLDATRTALNARNAAYYNDLAQRDEQIAALEDELARLRAAHRRLRERQEVQVAELDAARSELARLTSRLEGEEEEPLIEADVQQIRDALEQASRASFQDQQRMARYLSWKDRFAVLEGAGKVEVEMRGAQTVIRVPTKLLFNEGRVSVSPRGEVLLKDLAVALRDSPDHTIQVIAHTDDQPFHTAEFNSSWELGFRQAMTLVRALEQSGISEGVTAGSAAGKHPIADNDTAEGRERNRRIELVITQRPILQAIQEDAKEDEQRREREGDEPEGGEPGEGAPEGARRERSEQE